MCVCAWCVRVCVSVHAYELVYPSRYLLSKFLSTFVCIRTYICTYIRTMFIDSHFCHFQCCDATDICGRLREAGSATEGFDGDADIGGRPSARYRVG